MTTAIFLIGSMLAQRPLPVDPGVRELAAARRGYDARNIASAYVLAAAYQRLGGSYAARGHYPGALQNYHGALLVLNQIAGSNPNDPRVRGELLAIAGRVRALGGKIPVWVNIPIGDRSGPDNDARAVPVAEEPAPEFSLPSLDDAKLSEAERKPCEAAIDRYTQTAATAQAALSVLSGLRASVQSHGLSLRADYVAAESRIKLRIESAKRSIEFRKCEESMEPMAIANEEVSRLLRQLGQ